MLTLSLLAALITIAADPATPAAPDTLRKTDTTATAPVSRTMIRLREMVITATRTRMDERQAPASVTVIAPDPVAPAQSPQASLASLAGASFGANGGTGSSSSLYLRGAASENVLVLLDGIPLNSSLMGLYDLTKISGDAGRIEVVRGAMSSLYGANAVGGVVNITTPEPDSGRPHSRVTYQKGNYGGQQLRAQFSRSLAPGASMWLGVDWTADGGQRRNSAYDGTNYSVGANVGPYRGVSAKGFLQIYKVKVGVPGSLSYPDTVSTQWDDQQDMQLRLGHRCTVGGQEHNGFLAIARSDIETKYYDGYATTKNKSRQSTVNGQYTLALLPGYQLSAGGDYLLSECRSDNSGDHDLRQKSLFCNNLYSGIDGLLLTAGARWDKNLFYKYQVSPSLGASYRVTGPLTAYASYGQAYRAPTVNELFWKDDVWMMYGDPGLRPEHSWQSEAGLKAYLNRLTASGCFFHRTTRDLITWAALPDRSLRTENVYGVLANGIEATLSASILPWLKAGLNYTWCRTVRDDSTHAVLPYHPQNTANAGITVDDLRLARRLWWGYQFDARYTDSQDPGPSVPGTLPRTIICNQTASLRIWNARIYWTIDNLFNAQYQTRHGYPMPRRSYAVGVSMEMWE